MGWWQTGSGKTHTMLGDIVDLDHWPSDDRGMTPRVFEHLFAKIHLVWVASFFLCAIPWAALVCTFLSCCKKSGWAQLSCIYSQVTEEHHYVAGWRTSQAWESEVYLQVLFPGDLQWADHWLAWTIIYKSAGKELITVLWVEVLQCLSAWKRFCEHQRAL